MTVPNFRTALSNGRFWNCWSLPKPLYNEIEMDRIKTNLSNDLQVQHVYHAKANKGGNYLIYLRFYIILKTIRIYETTVSTGITSPKSRWNNGTIKGTDIGTQLKNERLAEILTIVKDGLHDLKKFKIQSVQAIKSEIEQGLKVKITNKPPKRQRQNYLSILTSHTLTTVKDSYLSTKNVTKTYKKNFRLSVQKFNDWWEITYNTTAPAICDITVENMKAFKSWLKAQREVSHNTVTTYLNRLRTIFNHALSLKLIPETPIKKGFIEGFKTGEQVALTVDELIKINNIPDNELSETLKKVKYIFLFLCSTGLGYGELKSLKLSHIIKDQNDFIITKERNKTDVEFTVLMSETAKHIFTTHLNPLNPITGLNNEPFANLPSIEYVTRMVKVLAAKAGIKKNITTYVGRKSFATQWANDGNNIYYLQLMLGHTNPLTTMKYVNLNKTQMVENSREAFKRNAFHVMQLN